MSDSDWLKELCDVLDAAGARLSFDSGRSISNQCTFCGRTDEPRGLFNIGRYFDGSLLTRPVCARCEPIAKARESVRKDTA